MPRAAAYRYVLSTMDNHDRADSAEESIVKASDLARRLARYRQRVEEVGRPRSVKLIDRAIEDAGGVRNSHK